VTKALLAQMREVSNSIRQGSMHACLAAKVHSMVAVGEALASEGELVMEDVAYVVEDGDSADDWEEGDI